MVTKASFTVMHNSGELIQRYLDACANPSCFCNGFVMSHSPRFGLQPAGPGPNCEVRHNCPLFRNATARPIRMWNASGNPKRGCDAYAFWELEKSQQLEDSKEWEVTMAGTTRIVSGRDALSAAVRMFLLLREDGAALDKMILLDRNYTIREIP